MMSVRSSHRKISIGLRTITIDFIANITAAKAKPSILSITELTSCTMLEVTLVRPSPRSATGFAQLRSNVQQFVDLLSTSKETIPKLAVKLGSSSPVDHNPCGYNDFAILTGPFYKLRVKNCGGVTIERSTGSPFWSQRINQQCDLIEHAIEAPSDTSILKYQQCMLEIKIPLTLIACVNETTLSMSETTALQQKLAECAFQACNGLREWCSETANPEPIWLDRLLQQITKPGWLQRILQQITNSSSYVTDSNLRNEILDAQDSTVLTCWLAGHNQAYNRFWDENLMV